jgi:hypothetical protein
LKPKNWKDRDLLIGNVIISDYIAKIIKYKEPLDIIASKVFAEDYLTIRHQLGLAQEENKKLNEENALLNKEVHFLKYEKLNTKDLCTDCDIDNPSCDKCIGC